MKKNTIIIFFTFCFLLLTNCNKEEKKLEENKIEKTEVATLKTKEENLNDIVIENKKIKFSDESFKLFKKYTKRAELIIYIYFT